MVKAPILAKTVKICHRDTLFSIPCKGNSKFSKKCKKKFVRLKIIATFAVPFETNGIFYEFFDNTERLKVQGSKYKRASVSLEKLRSVRGKLRFIRIYNEEFDPGSG